MEKEFVTYEQALALKELGFESPYPIGGYQGGKIFYYEKGELHYDGRPMYSSDAHSGQLLAPLYQQASRFFREKYMLLHEIVFYRENKRTKKGYWYVIDKWNKEFTKREIIGTTVYFETYEEAESACLDKLIELVGKAK